MKQQRSCEYTFTLWSNIKYLGITKVIVAQKTYLVGYY